jgi:hypothetical protein
MQLSDVLLSPSSSSRGHPLRDESIFLATGSRAPDESAEGAQNSGWTFPGESSASISPAAPTIRPSNLSILLRRQQSDDVIPIADPPLGPSSSTEHLPRIRRLPSVSDSSIRFATQPPNRASVYEALLSPSPSPSSRDRDRTRPSGGGESTPLLQTSVMTTLPSYTARATNSMSELKTKNIIPKITRCVKEAMTKESLGHVAMTSLKSLPAVLLGTLLNILDGVSCE